MASIEEIKDAAERSLITFIKLVAPQRVLGNCHEDVCKWWTRQESKTNYTGGKWHYLVGLNPCGRGQSLAATQCVSHALIAGAGIGIACVR